MEKVLILVVLIVVTVLIFKLRGDAAKDRKAVMARLAAEREERGGIDYSPTAELFREIGIRHDPGAPIPHGRAIPDFPPPPVGVPEFPMDVTAEPTGFDAAPDLTGREVATPPTPPMPSAPAAPATTEPGDLRTLFKGISMPAGLKPLGPLVPANANFVTDAPPSVVHAGLDAEFERLACAARWVEPTIAQTERNGMRGLVTIYPNPTAALDLDGNPLFPGVGPGHVVVRMLAL